MENRFWLIRSGPFLGQRITKFPFSAVLWPFRTGLVPLLEALAKEEIAMRIGTAGIAALVAAAGIWMSFSAGPAMAAKSAATSNVAAADRPLVLSKFKKQRRVHATKKSRTAVAKNVKKSTSKTPSKSVAQKPAAKEAPVRTAETDLPPAVANARAQALADDEARNIAALDSTDVPIVDGVQIAAAGQPGDADSAPTVAQNSAAAASPPAIAPPPPAPSGKIIRAVSSGEKPVFKADDSDPWSKTTLIGKIFIAFGSLLTLASAARLFIA